jgi:hypothetical protein
MGIALGQHIKTLRKENKMSALSLSKDVGIQNRIWTILKVAHVSRRLIFL